MKNQLLGQAFVYSTCSFVKVCEIIVFITYFLDVAL